MTRTRYRIFEDGHPCFLTSTIVGWLPVFAHPPFAEIIPDSWRFLQREREVAIYGFVIMENHLHWIASGEGLTEQVVRFKSYTARRIIDEMEKGAFTGLLEELRRRKLAHKTDQTHQLWQEGSHPEQIQNEAMMRQKLDYMHNNPLRRGYVDDPTHWRYSSARNYEGRGGSLDVATNWG